ncbi:hypothetical protein BLNAU_1708 [Blattamonas nauphoetae]|uniref:Uncharacterized protein n=1 Tax=Blattamonas nauphoetae TaxID=2049346 RepID=A0ABQ9YHE0_9EUKA|nr:hypothetical protein BLNAU_1708 [Blattamonas nauphoetae]
MRRRSQLLTNMIHISDTRLFPHQIPLLATTLYSLFNTKNEKEETCSSADLVSQPGYQSSVFSLNNQVSLTRLRQSSRIISLDKTEPQLLSQFSARAIRDDDAVAAIKRNMELLEMKGDQFIIKEDIGSKDHIDMQDDSDGSMNNFSDSGNLGSPGMQTMSDSESIDLLFSPVPGDDEKRDVRHSQDLNLSLPLKPSISSGTESNSPLELDQTKKSSPTSLIKGQTISHLSSISPDSQLGSASQTMKLFSQPDSTSQSLPRKKSPGIQEEMTKALSARSFHTRPESPVVQSSSLFKPATSLQSSPTLFLAPPNVQIPIRPKQLSPPPTSLSLVINDSSVDDGYENSIAHKSSSPTMHIPLVPMSPYSDSEASVYSDDFKQPVVPKIQIKETTTVEPIHQTPSSPLILGDDPPEPLKGGKPTSSLSLTIQNPDLELSHRTPGALSGSFQFEGYSDDSDASVYDDSAPSPPPPLKDVSTSKFAPTALPKPHGKAVPSLLFSGSDQIQTQSSGEELHEPPLLVDADDDSSLSSLPLRGEGSSHIAKLHKPEGKLLQSRFPQLESNYSITKASTEVFSGQLDGSSQSLIDKQRIENEQITMNLSIALFLVGIGEWDVIDQAASDSIGRQLTQDVTHFNKSRLQQKEQLEMFQFSLMWEYHHVTPLVNDMCRFAFGIERMISKPFCVITPQITVQESFHRLLYVILKDIQQSLKEELGKTASQQTQFQANQEIGLDGTPVSELGAERQSGTMTTLFHLLQQSESDVSPIGLSPYARERLVKQIVSLFISNIQAEIQSMKFYQALLFYFTLCNFTKEKSSFLSKVELSVLLYHRSMFIHKPSAMERNRHSSSTQVTPIDFADNFLEKTKLFMPLEAWALETHHLIPRNPVPMWMPNYVWKNLFCLAAVCPSFRPMVEDLDESTTQTFHMIDKLPQAPIQTKTPFNLFDPYFEQILKQELDAETVVWDQTETQDTIWLDMMDEDGKKQIHSMAGSSSAKQGSTTISSHFVTPIQALWGEWFISMDPACSPTPNKKINALNQHQRAILIAAIRPSQIGKALTQALLSDYDLEPDHALFMGSLPSISLHSDQTMNSESESIVSSRHFYCGQAWIEDLFKRNVYMTGTEIDRCPFRIILLSAGSYPYQSCHNSINIITDLRSIAKKRSVPFLHLSIISKFRNYCPTSFDTNASPSEIDQAWLSTWFAFKEDVENVLSRGGWIVIPDIRFTAPIFLREIGRWMNRCGNGDTPFMSQKTNGTSTVRLSDKRGDAGNDITPPAIWIINAECDTLSNMDLVTNIVFATASTIDKRKIRPPCTFRGFAIYGLTLAIQIFPQKSILDMVKALNSKEQINGPLYCSICHLLFLFVMFNALLVEYSRNRSNTQDWFTFSTRTLTFGFSRLQAMIQSSQKSNRNSQSDNPLRLYDFVNVSQLIYVIETEIYTSLPASLPMAVFRKLEATMFSPDRFIVNDGPPVYRGISNPEDSTHLNGLGQYMQTILHHRSVDNIDETTQHIHRMKSNSFSQLSIVEQFLISFAGTLDPLSPLVVTTNNYHDTSYRTWDVCSDYQIIDTVQHFVVDVNAIPPHFLATIPRIVQSFESNPNIVESTLKEIQNLLQGALFDVDSILKTVHHPTFWQGHPDTDMHMVNESLMFNFSASTLYGALQTVLDHHKMTKLPTDTLSLSLLHGTHFPSNDLSLEPFIAHTGLIIPTREGLFAPAPYFSAKHHTGLSSLGRVRDKALMQYSLGFSDPPTFFSRFFRLNEKRSSSMTKPPGSDYSLKAENLGIGVERFLSRFLQINDYFSSIPLPSRIKNLNQIDASSTIFSLLNTNRTEPLQICRPINPGVLFNTPNIFLSLRIDELTRNRRDLSFSESSPPTDQQGSKSTVITLDSLSMELHPTNLRSLSDVTAASADQQLQSPPISSLATPSTQRLFVLGGLNLRSSIPTIFELHNIHLRLTSHQQPTFIFIKSNRSNILSLFTLPNTALLFPSFEFPTSADILPSDLSGTAVPTYGLPFLSTGFTSLRRHGDAKHANLQVQTCTEKGINDVYYVLANSDLNSALLFSHSTMVKFS